SHASPTSLSTQRSGEHRDLHSFPTRRSSDLGGAVFAVRDAGLELELHRRLRRPDRPGRGQKRRLRRLRGGAAHGAMELALLERTDRKSTRLNSSHVKISYAVFCLKKKKKTHT